VPLELEYRVKDLQVELVEEHLSHTPVAAVAVQVQ
jgi:hypothetical protein